MFGRKSGSETPQKESSGLSSYNELMNYLYGMLDTIRDGDIPKETGDLYGFSPEYRRIMELVNEIVISTHEQHMYQLTKLSLAVQAAHVGLWDMLVVRDDPVNPSNVFNWSDDFRHMLGYENQEDFPNLLNSWSDKLHPDDKERTLNAFAAHMNDRTGKTPYDLEYRLLKKNGDYNYYRAYGSTMRDDAGYPLRVAGALQDISEEKKTELEKLKLSLVMQAANIALWDMEIVKEDPVNPNNVFTWSDEFRRMLGYETVEEFPDILSSWSDKLHPEDKERTLDAFAAHMTDKTGRIPYDIEYRLLKKNGEYSRFRAFGATVRDQEGNPIRVAGALQHLE